MGLQLVSSLLAGFLLASPAAAGVVYACGPDGQMHQRCCCRTVDTVDADEADPPAELESAPPSCCELRATQGELPEAVTESEARRGVPPAASVAVSTAALPDPGSSECTAGPWHHSRAGPAPPSLYLRHCVFLI